jgi:hypothetical protein
MTSHDARLVAFRDELEKIATLDKDAISLKPLVGAARKLVSGIEGRLSSAATGLGLKAPKALPTAGFSSKGFFLNPKTLPGSVSMRQIEANPASFNIPKLVGTSDKTRVLSPHGPVATSKPPGKNFSITPAALQKMPPKSNLKLLQNPEAYGATVFKGAALRKIAMSHLLKGQLINCPS